MKLRPLGEMELRFAKLIWECAPVGSGELVRRCEQAFGWKKSTTYTMLKRLCQRGLFENTAGMVTATISLDQYRQMRTEAFVEENFGGSVPQFLAAFAARRTLSEREIDQIQTLIDQYRG